jgi:hypothetical protein
MEDRNKEIRMGLMKAWYMDEEKEKQEDGE